jgi:hypothetical protein
LVSFQGKFLLLAILDDFVKRGPQLEERSDIRNLQDITTRIVTDISQVAGQQPVVGSTSDAEAVDFLALPLSPFPLPALPLPAESKRFRFQICFQFCFSIQM